MLERGRRANFRTPEACADAIAAALRGGARRRRDRCRLRIRAWSAGTRAACSTSWRPTHCSIASGFRVRRRSRSTRTSRAHPTLPFGYPVAVKVLSAEIAHKTDVGGVVLNVADGEALLAAIAQHAAASSSAHRRRMTACWSSRWCRARRGAGRLPRRPGRGAARDAGGRRRSHRDLPRSQPAAGAGRSRRRARDDRRGASSARSLAIAASLRAISTRWRRRSSRCRSSRSSMIPSLPKPRSIR